MTDYNDGNWHGWNGGERPVHRESIIDACFANGPAGSGFFGTREAPAGDWVWKHNMNGGDLVAFRVVKVYREPKEYTIDPRKNIIWYSSEDDLVHVKELGL